MGLSSDPPDGFRLPDYADCLAGFVDALGMGHLINLEAWERLNAEIRAFLRSRGRVGG